MENIIPFLKGDCRSDNRCKGHRNPIAPVSQWDTGDDGRCINDGGDPTAAWELVKSISVVVLLFGYALVKSLS